MLGIFLLSLCGIFQEVVDDFYGICRQVSPWGREQFIRFLD